MEAGRITACFQTAATLWGYAIVNESLVWPTYILLLMMNQNEETWLGFKLWSEFKLNT